MPIYQGTIFFEDNFNRKTTRQYGVTAIDFATARTAFLDFVTATSPLSQCGIVRWSLSEFVDFATVIIPGANVDAGLTMSWELSPLGSGKLAPTKLPSPPAALFDANGNLLLANVDVIAYGLEMLSGDILISDGETPADLKSGRLDK